MNVYAVVSACWWARSCSSAGMDDSITGIALPFRRAVVSSHRIVLPVGLRRRSRPYHIRPPRARLRCGRSRRHLAGRSLATSARMALTRWARPRRRSTPPWFPRPPPSQPRDRVSEQHSYMKGSREHSGSARKWESGSNTRSRATTGVRDRSRGCRPGPHPTATGMTGHASLRVIVLVGIPSVGGDLCDEVVSPQHRLPQQLG